MADIEKTKTGIFEMLQRNTWHDIDEERHRFQPVLNDALELLEESEWKDASIRPPREGRYLVWGLHEFIPDHADLPNAYWQTRIAQWSNYTGWDTKVKFWRELPEPPKDGEQE